MLLGAAELALECSALRGSKWPGLPSRDVAGNRDRLAACGQHAVLLDDRLDCGEARVAEAERLAGRGHGLVDEDELAHVVDRNSHQNELLDWRDALERLYEPAITGLFEVGCIHGVVDVPERIEVSPADVNRAPEQGFCSRVILTGHRA